MRAARPLAACCVVVLAVLATACGGDHAAGTAASPPVRLTVERPADLAVTRDTAVTVSGSVRPAGAAVQVGGRPAEVTGGGFTARVDLEPGANVIDLAATASGHAPALTAFRVTREMPVVVPDLEGLTGADARAAVEALGLRLAEERSGGLLEELLPGEPGVCRQRPDAGAEVMRGTEVDVLLGKRC
jgi:hypothetical protein